MPSIISPLPVSQSALTRTKTPRLLVSARNAREALAAVAGGCEILDIKEPHRGSLGMADPSIIAEILQVLPPDSQRPLISAALGEVIDWPLNQASVQNVLGLSVPYGCDLLKIGCAGLESGSTWRTHWNQTRRQISATLTVSPRWVAVAYVDWQPANAPQVAEIVQAALQDGCCGVLLDTFTKSGRWLLDWISVEELQEIAEQVHARGLFLALAGSLNVNNMDLLKTVPTDIFAIRGAACLQADRTSEISQTAVQEFKKAMVAVAT